MWTSLYFQEYSNIFSIHSSRIYFSRIFSSHVLLYKTLSGTGAPAWFLSRTFVGNSSHFKLDQHYNWASQKVPVVKNSSADAGDLRDADSIPGLGGSPGGGHGNPLQCSCLENPTDRGAWQAAVPGAADWDTHEVTQHTHTSHGFQRYIPALHH